MSEPNWKVVKEETESNWLEVQDVDAGLSAQVRRDGCIDLRRCYNGMTFGVGNTDTDYLHICELDEMIASLQSLKQKALEHFGES